MNMAGTPLAGSGDRLADVVMAARELYKLLGDLPGAPRSEVVIVARGPHADLLAEAVRARLGRLGRALDTLDGKEPSHDHPDA
jgi:hypothetical protein